MEFASLEKLYQWLLNQVPVASENKIVPFHTERMRILQAAIGNPQDNYKIVHVTGSKGKGTVATMIASAFTECGAISGLYTSPHVQKWKERIRILPVDLLDKDLLKIANHVLNTVTMNVREPLPGDVNPTFFELTTLIAYEAYKVVGCDTAVLECGLGGLNDATNSIGKKAATVLTSIELEHMNVLGHSLAEITHQKMGIIREDVPLVVGRLPVDILSLILTIAEEKNVPVFAMDRDFNLTNIEISMDGTKACLDLNCLTKQKFEISTPLIGRYFAFDASLAFITASLVMPHSSEMNILKGISSTILPCRFEVLSKVPPFIVDSSHTIRSVQSSVESFVHFAGTEGILLIAVQSAKPIAGILRVAIKGFSLVIATTTGGFKTDGLPSLVEILNHSIVPHIIIPNQDEAITFAINKHFKEKKPVLVCGSLFLASNSKQIFYSA